MDTFIKFENVCKTYTMGEVKIEALKNASFTVKKGEICIIEISAIATNTARIDTAIVMITPIIPRAALSLPIANAKSTVIIIPTINSTIATASVAHQ